MGAEMRRCPTALLCALIATTLARVAGAAELPKLAVVHIAPKVGIDTSYAEAAEEYLATRIAETGAYEVIARDDVASMLEHAGQLELMGCDGGACLAEVGGALGADLLVKGSLTRIDDHATVSLKLINVGSSSVDRREVVEVPIADDKVGRAAMQALKIACDQMFAAELTTAGIASYRPSKEPAGEGEEVEPEGSGGRLFTWIAAGGGAALLAAGGGLLVLGNVEMLAAQELADSSASEQVSYQDFAEVHDRAQLEQIGGLALLGVGGLAVVAAVVLFFVEGG